MELAQVGHHQVVVEVIMLSFHGKEAEGRPGVLKRDEVGAGREHIDFGLAVISGASWFHFFIFLFIVESSAVKLN